MYVCMYAFIFYRYMYIYIDTCPQSLARVWALPIGKGLGLRVRMKCIGINKCQWALREIYCWQGLI